MRTIRFKLFLLISAAVAAPVAVLSVYFPAAQIARLDEALQAKAGSFARVVGELSKSALSFDDVETVREAFASVEDEDVVFLGLYHDDGRALYTQGEAHGVALPTRRKLVVERRHDRVRARASVISAEGYRGVLVVELSTDRLQESGAAVRRASLLVGLAALVGGCIGAWLVGRSFGRRVSAITERATAVAAGDLSPAMIDKRSDDEIGKLARSFDQMVWSLRELAGEIDDAGTMLGSSTGLFLEMAREEEARAASTAESVAFSASIVAGLTELRQYSETLREVVGRFEGLQAPGAPGPEMES